MFLEEEDGTGASFDFERWAVHRSSSRYSRLLLGFFGSTTRRIFPTIFGLTTFSVLVDYYNQLAKQPIAPGALTDLGLISLPELQLPITPFELTAPVLGLLLVFRTDTAYDRFNLGSDVAWEITASLRSVMRRLVSWSGSAACADSAERAAALDLVDASAMLHGRLMGQYLRGGAETQESRCSQAALLRTALGVGDGADEELDTMASEAELTPYLALAALSLGVSRRLPSLSDQERIALDDGLSTVTCALAKCEKLLRTPIPLGYTRYSVRFLWIWLSLLPFALTRTFSEFGVNTWWEDKPQPVVVLAMLFIGFIFLSIEDIAVQIEEPFAILPLEQHQKWLLRDADQMKQLARWATADAGGAAVPQVPLLSSVNQIEGGPVPGEREGTGATSSSESSTSGKASPKINGSDQACFS